MTARGVPPSTQHHLLSCLGVPLSCLAGYPPLVLSRLGYLAGYPPLVLSRLGYLAGSGTGLWIWTGPVKGLGGTPPEKTWDQRLGRDLGPEAGVPLERTWHQRLENGPGTRDWGSCGETERNTCENITFPSYFATMANNQQILWLILKLCSSYNLK